MVRFRTGPTICTLLAIVMLPLATLGQNLIRNHSFEQGSGSKPTELDELDGHCTHWKRHNDEFNGGYKDSPDWFEAVPGKLRGSVRCGILGKTSQNSGPFVPANDGTHFAGLVKQHDYQEGEGIQQKLNHKLQLGYYTLDFDYLLPCDTQEYGFKIFFGKTANHLDFLAKELSVPTQNIGVWQHLSLRFMVPLEWDNKLDWFIFLANGSSPIFQAPNLGAYTYIDNFQLVESPCSSCDPNGLISWNQAPLDFISANGDGVFDEWCLQNINNVSWYVMEVYDRWGVRVRRVMDSDPNGFENLAICWDGRNDQGSLLPFYNVYYITITLGNCSKQITNQDPYEVVVIPSAIKDTLVHDTLNYVPPLFGLEPPPTHYRQLHLYGGPYYGTHDWYACNAIFIEGDGAPRVPYFHAASTSNLGFYATDAIFIDSTDFMVDFGADVDIDPMPVQCCPQMRLADPAHSASIQNAPYDSMTTSFPIDLESGMEDEEAFAMDEPKYGSDDGFRMDVVPNPATDLAKIVVHIPLGESAMFSIWNASGEEILTLNNGQSLEGGDHEIQLTVKRLPAGLYYLRGQSVKNLVLRKMVVGH